MKHLPKELSLEENSIKLSFLHESWKITCDLGPLYSAYHCKHFRSIPHSLIFIHVNFKMASTLTKAYRVLLLSDNFRPCFDFVWTY